MELYFEKNAREKKAIIKVGNNFVWVFLPVVIVIIGIILLGVDDAAAYSISARIGISLAFLGMYVLLFLTIYPLRIEIVKTPNGDIEITKRTAFYITKHFSFIKNEDPQLKAGHTLIGPGSIVLSNRRTYSLSIANKQNSQDISLLFNIFWFIRYWTAFSRKTVKLYFEDQIQKLGQFLELPIQWQK